MRLLNMLSSVAAAVVVLIEQVAVVLVHMFLDQLPYLHHKQ